VLPEVLQRKKEERKETMMQAVKRKTKPDNLRRTEQKWSKPLADAGWMSFPSVFLLKQDALGLDAVDINILLHLAEAWWYADNPPKLSKSTIARRMNVDPSTIRRRITKMVVLGFIKRTERKNPDRGQLANEYSLAPLIEYAKPFAQEIIEERNKRRKEDRERAKRKKPRLKIVKPDEDMPF
jgi:predicted transcriptional regulator